MTKKTKVGTKESDQYQKLWDAYVKENEFSPTVLLPLELGINDKGEIYRRRMKAGDITEIWEGIKNAFPSYMKKKPDMFDNPAQIFGEYIKFFDDYDGTDMPPPRTPLDIKITHPTWLLYSLDNPNWKFCEHGAQYSTENDPDDQSRNFVKIATFDDPRLPKKDLHGQLMSTRKLLLLANRNRSTPDNLKFNLHVDVLQTLFGQYNSTTIVIDPGGNNDPNHPWGD